MREVPGRRPRGRPQPLLDETRPALTPKRKTASERGMGRGERQALAAAQRGPTAPGRQEEGATGLNGSGSVGAHRDSADPSDGRGGNRHSRSWLVHSLASDYEACVQTTLRQVRTGKALLPTPAGSGGGSRRRRRRPGPGRGRRAPRPPWRRRDPAVRGGGFRARRRASSRFVILLRLRAARSRLRGPLPRRRRSPRAPRDARLSKRICSSAACAHSPPSGSLSAPASAGSAKAPSATRPSTAAPFTSSPARPHSTSMRPCTESRRSMRSSVSAARSGAEPSGS